MPDATILGCSSDFRQVVSCQDPRQIRECFCKTPYYYNAEVVSFLANTCLRTIADYGGTYKSFKLISKSTPTKLPTQNTISNPVCRWIGGVASNPQPPAGPYVLRATAWGTTTCTLTPPETFYPPLTFMHDAVRGIKLYFGNEPTGFQGDLTFLESPWYNPTPHGGFGNCIAEHTFDMYDAAGIKAAVIKIKDPESPAPPFIACNGCCPSPCCVPGAPGIKVNFSGMYDFDAECRSCLGLFSTDQIICWMDYEINTPNREHKFLLQTGQNQWEKVVNNELKFVLKRYPTTSFECAGQPLQEWVFTRERIIVRAAKQGTTCTISVQYWLENDLYAGTYFHRFKIFDTWNTIQNWNCNTWPTFTGNDGYGWQGTATIVGHNVCQCLPAESNVELLKATFYGLSTPAGCYSVNPVSWARTEVISGSLNKTYELSGGNGHWSIDPPNELLVNHQVFPNQFCSGSPTFSQDFINELVRVDVLEDAGKCHILVNYTVYHPDYGYFPLFFGTKTVPLIFNCRKHWGRIQNQLPFGGSVLLLVPPDPQDHGVGHSGEPNLPPDGQIGPLP